MRLFKSILVAIAIMVLTLWLGSLTLSEKWHFEKSISVNTTPNRIYQLTTDLKNWEKWSPWFALDINTKWTFSDSTFGVGAWYTWSSKESKVGAGKLTIIEAIENQSNKYIIEFEGMDASKAGFILTPEGDNTTKVTWTLEGENKGIAKWFGLLMVVFVGNDYEKGLENIKRICEAK
jgi:hypothetical protein